MGGGNFITQSYPTNFHTFFKRKILTPKENIEDFKEVTEAEKNALEKSDSAWERPPQSFIDQWNIACGEWGCYNEATGYFELNGLTDITYQQAVIIMQAPPGPYLYNVNSGYAGFMGRTIIPPSQKGSGIGFNGFTSYDLVCTFFRCSNLEVVRLSGDDTTITATSIGLPFTATSLKKILGGLDLGRIKTSISSFNEMQHIEDMKLKNCCVSIDFRKSSKLNKDSVKYLVDNAANSDIIIITLHPTLYNALQGEADYPFNGGSKEEWEQILQTATERQIQFASA